MTDNLTQREQIARIIDFEAWDETHAENNEDGAAIFAEAWEVALAKADAILARDTPEGFVLVPRLALEDAADEMHAASIMADRYSAYGMKEDFARSEAALRAMLNAAPTTPAGGEKT